MGLSITISKRSELRVSSSRGKIILRSLQRAFIFVLLGLMLNSIHAKSLKDLRFPGVLQLLAISYFICATIETIFMRTHSQVWITFSSLNDSVLRISVMNKSVIINNLLGRRVTVRSIHNLARYLEQLDAVVHHFSDYGNAYSNHVSPACPELSNRILGTWWLPWVRKIPQLYWRCSRLYRQTFVWKSHILQNTKSRVRYHLTSWSWRYV